MIDARGYSCPMPVVMVQNEVKKNAPASLDVLVDSMTCVENVTRFAEKQGYKVEYAAEGEDFRLKLNKYEKVGLPYYDEKRRLQSVSFYSFSSFIRSRQSGM